MGRNASVELRAFLEASTRATQDMHSRMETAESRASKAGEAREAFDPMGRHTRHDISGEQKVPVFSIFGPFGPPYLGLGMSSGSYVFISTVAREDDAAALRSARKFRAKPAFLSVITQSIFQP